MSKSRNGGRPAGLEAWQREEAARLYRSGWPLRRLGRRYGVSRMAVYRALTAAGVEMRARGGAHEQLVFPDTEPVVWVDPIWGRLAFLAYTPREGVVSRGVRASQDGKVLIDLGAPAEE